MNIIEYKYLSMDEDEEAQLTAVKPYWDSGEWLWEDSADSFDFEKPDFLKPCQLWEREDRYYDPSCQADQMAKTKTRQGWRGYWWRKVADCGQSEQPAEADQWIVNRRPTVEDAWRGLVMCISHDNIPYCCHYTGVGNRPWQPVPASLHIPPRQEQPQTCDGYVRK